MGAARRGNGRKHVRLWPGLWRGCRLACNGGSNRNQKILRSRQPKEDGAVASTEGSMAWADPAAMPDDEIEAELSAVGLQLSETLKTGGKIAQLEGKQWRLRFEQRFRGGRS